VIVATDDTAPDRVRGAIRAINRDERAVLYLTPHVLFEPGGLTDLERAYERYWEFERFRCELDRLPNAEAFEVAPGDRLDVVLDAQGER
jgi:hypothetical protein